MGNKLPYMQFYPSDWLSDTRLLTVSAKAAWIDTIATLWNTDPRGILTETNDAWCRIWSGAVPESAVPSVMEELQKVAIVIRRSDMSWTIASRRLIRDEIERERSRESKRPDDKRQQPYREFIRHFLPEYFRGSSLKIPDDIPEDSRRIPGNLPEHSRTIPGDKLETRDQTKHPHPARARGAVSGGLEPKISRILSAFNIGTDPAMIGRTAMDEFLSQPQFLEDAAIEVIRQKAPAWMDQDWIRDVSPRLVAKHLAEIYNYQPKTEVTSNAADKYENGF